MNIKEIAQKNPILAIMRNVPLEKTVKYAGAILEGGVAFFEVALNSVHALAQIDMLRKTFGDKAYIGAGTAITIERAKAAMNAGAQFLLSPSSDADVLAYCQKEKIAMLPGALTPTDVSLCVRHGFHTIKLFPAGDMPRGYIKSLKGPFDDTDYVAIGGVNSENIADFMHEGYLSVGIGSNMVPREAMEKEDWAAVSAYVHTLLEKARS